MKTYTEGQWHEEGYYSDAEHIVLNVSSEPILINFVRAIDDVIISSPDGDILLAWKLGHDTEWDDNKCMILTIRDNMKEIGNLKTTLLAVKAKEESKTLTVYITAQRN